MSDETDTPARPRASRFKEHTNTNSSIRPPPDEMWKDLGIEHLIEQFNEDNRAPPRPRKTAAQTATFQGPVASRVADGPVTLRASSETRAPGVYEAQSIDSAPGTFGVLSVTAQAVSTTVAPITPAPASNEGTFGRFQRAFASVFGGVLGKRKAGNVDAEKEKEKEKKVLDDRKKAADAAYQEAKELGLLPTPKVFVRPAMAAKSHNCVADAPTLVRTPRTPRLHRTPSKKDLLKQKKLSKRVSELELKLASAKKELQSVLHSDNLPPVPPLPMILPPTPTASQSEHDIDVPSNTTDTITDAVAAPVATPVAAPSPATPEQPVGKITKKRKAVTSEEEEYKAVATDSDGDVDMQLSGAENEVPPKRTVKRVKSSPARRSLRKQPSRLKQRMSRSNLKPESPVRLVPDGISVPPMPSIPKGVKGKKAKLADDGYGGLEHEMF